MASSRSSPSAAAVASAALVGVAPLLLSQSANFIAAPGTTPTQGSALSTGVAVGSWTSSPTAHAGATGGVATAVAACGLAAAAGLATKNRRRTAAAAIPGAKEGTTLAKLKIQQSQAMYAPRLVINGMDTVNPLCFPGSEKALKTMVGADVEMGAEPWDPMGFSKLYDRNFDFNNVMTYPHVQWLREAEIKHGRICMIAFVGMVVQQFVQIPGYPQEPDWTKALTLCYEDKLASLGIVQISGFAMLMEGKFYSGDAWIGQMDREPGDFGFDPLKVTKRAGFNLKEKQLNELKNGRLAMIGVASLAANHAIPGSVPFLTGFFAVRPEAAEGSAAQGAFCGKTRPIATSTTSAPGKTAARYTTQVILPSLQWLKVGFKADDIKIKELKAVTVGENDILIGKDEDGKIFGVANLCPHIGTPMSEGADVIGDVIICPLHGSSFSTKTGDMIDWCPSPPIIGPLTGLVVDRKNLLIYDVRQSFFGGDIEVLVDTNAKKAYEADFWKGILDAQGKNDGTYY